MINRAIHQFWVGEMPPEIYNWMKTVRAHHPDWEYRLWDDCNINDLGLNCEDLKFWCVNWAGVSNIVRLHALNQFGGVYLDSDVECLRPLDPLLIHDAFCALQDKHRICNAIAAATPNHPWIKWQIARQEMLKCEDATTGVELMTEAPREGVTILPTHLLYPFGYGEPAEKQVAHPDSYTIHWWDGSWQKKEGA